MVRGQVLCQFRVTGGLLQPRAEHRRLRQQPWQVATQQHPVAGLLGGECRDRMRRSAEEREPAEGLALAQHLAPARVIPRRHQRDLTVLDQIQAVSNVTVVEKGIAFRLALVDQVFTNLVQLAWRQSAEPGRTLRGGNLDEALVVVIDLKCRGHGRVAHQVACRTVGPGLGRRRAHLLSGHQVVDRRRAAQPAVNRLGQPRRAHQQGEKTVAWEQPDLRVFGRHGGFVVRRASQERLPTEGLPATDPARQLHALQRVE